MMGLLLGLAVELDKPGSQQWKEQVPVAFSGEEEE